MKLKFNKIWGIVLAAVLLFLQATSVCVIPDKVDAGVIQDSTDFVPVENGAYYLIRNVATGRYVDIPDGKDENNLKIRTWTGNKTAAQQFTFIEKQTGWYVISPKCATTRALDNPAAST